jgi:hypothetical protein
MELQESNPREFTLENCIRMAFHPTGYRRFMQQTNKDLKIGPMQSSINLGAASFADISKYICYFALVGRLTYDIINNYLM